MTTRGHSLAIFCLLTAAACGPRGAVVMSNPLVSGAVEQNESHHRHGFNETVRGLPSRSLVTNASLTSLDSKSACFDLQLKWLSEPGSEADGEAYVDPDRLVARLEILGADYQLTRATSVERDEVTREPLVGHTNRVQQRNQLVCEGYGRHRRCFDVHEQVVVPVETGYTVMGGGGHVCFAHGGHIDTETEGLILTLSHPAEGERVAHRFAWKFE
ncbi:MAG: hypothetical protein HOW73_30395 [Polyangiaceae bacterium]|nr:hypothetical protein [Polyangiaceae bacterium]